MTEPNEQPKPIVTPDAFFVATLTGGTPQDRLRLTEALIAGLQSKGLKVEKTRIIGESTHTTYWGAHDKLQFQELASSLRTELGNLEPPVAAGWNLAIKHDPFMSRANQPEPPDRPMIFDGIID